MPKLSTYTILLSLFFFCCDIATSFTTTNYSFIKHTNINKYKHSPHTDTDNRHRRIQSILFHSNQKRFIAQTSTSTPFRNESRSRLFAASSNTNKSDSKTIHQHDDEDGNDSKDIIDSNEQMVGTSDSAEEIKIENKGLEKDEIISFSEDGLGAYNPSKKLPMKREVIVGDPQQRLKKEEKSVAEILTELAAIQKQGPQKYCILGTRHVSYLHQQIIELLSYALVLSENHVYTSGAMGTNASAIRGALRAGRPDLLTVILPQSLHKQTDESQELLRGVTDLITMPKNDDMSLDVASRLCNSKLLSETDQLVAFAFHESTTVIEATKEAKELDMLVTTLFLD